jgi:hypothetical protein
MKCTETTQNWQKWAKTSVRRRAGVFCNSCCKSARKCHFSVHIKPTGSTLLCNFAFSACPKSAFFDLNLTYVDAKLNFKKVCFCKNTKFAGVRTIVLPTVIDVLVILVKNRKSDKNAKAAVENLERNRSCFGVFRCTTVRTLRTHKLHFLTK